MTNGWYGRLRLAVSRILYPNIIHPLRLGRLSFWDWVVQATLMVLFASPVVFNLALAPTTRRTGWLLIGAYILGNVLKARKQLLPQYQRKAQENYFERKTQFAGILQRMVTWERERDGHGFQRDCLDLIANYVRSWHFDIGARVIFANLFVLDTTNSQRVKVIARDRERVFQARQVPTVCDKNEVAVAECFVSKDIKIVDDLSIEYPNTPPKAYRSILGVPLLSLDGQQVVGVLSIDSSEVCHFRKVSRELVWSLQPYIKALEFSLDRGVTDYVP
ncbi:MAG TPA: hypothetical protein VJZ00_23160 [Thermoanaerobaculia bacterium]|nr:hypothetical protein [Thermoanaerobaculia bacterium]